MKVKGLKAKELNLDTIHLQWLHFLVFSYLLKCPPQNTIKVYQTVSPK